MPIIATDFEFHDNRCRFNQWQYLIQKEKEKRSEDKKMHFLGVICYRIKKIDAESPKY